MESTFKLIDHEFNYVTNWYPRVQTREVLNQQVDFSRCYRLLTYQTGQTLGDGFQTRRQSADHKVKKNITIEDNNIYSDEVEKDHFKNKIEKTF